MNDGSVNNLSVIEVSVKEDISVNEDRPDTGHEAEQSQAPQSVKVEIYVADHCAICDYTNEVAKNIRRDFPDVELEIIDMAAPQRPIPEVVFATPTYLLNGQVWSLGNPSPEDVRIRLSEALAQTTSF